MAEKAGLNSKGASVEALIKQLLSQEKSSISDMNESQYRFYCHNKILDESLAYAVDTLAKSKTPSSENPPPKLANLGSKYNEMYQSILLRLSSDYDVNYLLKVAKVEYKIAALRFLRETELMIQFGFVKDDHARFGLSADTWWSFFDSKADAFFDHLSLVDVSSRLEKAIVCKGDDGIAEIILQAHILLTMIEADSLAKSLTKVDLLDYLFEITVANSHAVYESTWLGSEACFKEDESHKRRNYAKQRLEKNSLARQKNDAKIAIQQEWEKIPSSRKKYGWKEEFNRNMKAQYPVITGQRTITEWLDDWEKLLIS